MDPQIYRVFRGRYEDNWYFATRTKVLTTFMRPYCPVSADARIVDLGAGTGKILADTRQAAVAVAIEENPDLARFGRGRYGLPFVLANLSDDIPIGSGAIDLVLMLDVLEHVEQDRPLLSEVFRVLRPGGRLIISVPAFQGLWSRHDELHHHKRRYSRLGLLSVLAEAGFVCDRLTYYNTLLLPLVYLSRKLERFSRAWTQSASDYDKAPRALAMLLHWVFGLERKLIPRYDLPVGVSLLAVARRT